MDYKEQNKPGMKFVGIGINTTVQNAMADCPIAWNQFMKRYKEVKNYIGGMKNYGLCINSNPGECSFRYVACAEVSSFDDIPEGMEKVEIPTENYFIFSHKGKLNKLGQTYGEIMETIPKTNKKQKGGFWLEFYDYRWKGDKDNSECEIWIPLEDSNILKNK